MAKFYKPSKESTVIVEKKYPKTINMFNIALKCIGGLPKNIQQEYVDIYNEALKELINN